MNIYTRKLLLSSDIRSWQVERTQAEAPYLTAGEICDISVQNTGFDRHNIAVLYKDTSEQYGTAYKLKTAQNAQSLADSTPVRISTGNTAWHNIAYNTKVISNVTQKVFYVTSTSYLAGYDVDRFAIVSSSDLTFQDSTGETARYIKASDTIANPLVEGGFLSVGAGDISLWSVQKATITTSGGSATVSLSEEIHGGTYNQAFKKVAYGNINNVYNGFVATTIGSFIGTSSNGETWTIDSSGINDNYSAVLFDNNKFVLAKNNILYGSPGNWSQGASFAYTVNDGVYSNGVYYFCGNNGYFATSSNLTSLNSSIVTAGSITTSLPDWTVVRVWNNQIILGGKVNISGTDYGIIAYAGV